MIAAVEKAESLHRFAMSQGAHISTFKLMLSDAEGLELLDWFGEQHDNELLDLDIAEAKRTKNPWAVLENFQLLGFEVARATLELN